MLKLLGRPLFGKSEDGAILPWWWHSQNLDTRPGDDGFEASGSKLMHGRAWLYLGSAGSGRTPTIHVSWNLRSTFCHLHLTIDDDEHDITVGVALPPVALWFGVEGLPKGIFKALGVDYEKMKDLRDGIYLISRRTEIAIHNWALWWQVWMPEHMSRSTDPRWRSGSFHPVRFLFGDTKMTEKVIETHEVEIPMTERNYKGTVMLSRRTWARPRWPFRFGQLRFGQLRSDEVLFHEGLYYDLTMHEGEQIPFPGKGENSWDCGEDALFGQSGPGGLTDAIGAAVASVMRSRHRYGGSIGWAPKNSGAGKVAA